MVASYNGFRLCNNEAFKKNNRVLVKYSSEFYCIGAFLGSFFCHVLYHPRAIIPSGIIAISDVMILIEDMGNQIPDKSWMLYLEIFNKQNIPAEFDLIRSFNNDGKFDAIFNGINWYQLKRYLLQWAIVSPPNYYEFSETSY